MALQSINNEFSLGTLFVSEEAYLKFVNLLNGLGVKSIRSEFSGCGDSGAIDYIGFFSINIDESTGSYVEKKGAKLMVGNTPLNEEEFRKLNEWEQKNLAPSTLYRFIERLTGEALDLVGLDWYNNDGGQGMMMFYVGPDSLVIELEVGINYMETTDYSYRFQNFSGAGEEE